MKISIKTKLIITLFFALGWFTNYSFKTENNITTCFTPTEKCLPLIVNTINSAQNSIRVMAYVFTSQKLMESLILAHKRGINVIVIYDKKSINSIHSKIPILKKSGILCIADDTVSISHNKLIIIDNHTTLTGSYNFSNAAETRNAENIIIINDTNTASKYTYNFNTTIQRIFKKQK